MMDLHVHTNATPGHATWEPEALAAAAAEHSLVALAATDHNTTANVTALQVAGERHGIHVVSGVEIDSGYNGKLWHTLVYGVPPKMVELVALCTAVFERNAADAQRLREELPERGFSVPDFSNLEPPNVAQVAAALAHNNDLPGRVAGENDEAAGMRYLLTELPGAYRPLGVDEIITVVHHIGGVAVLAHPGRSNGIYAIPATTDDIAAMVDVGLDGIEVYYPTHTAEQQAFYGEQAKQHGLLVSGGSDSHHPHQPLATWGAYLAVELLERVTYGTV